MGRGEIDQRTEHRGQQILPVLHRRVPDAASLPVRGVAQRIQEVVDLAEDRGCYRLNGSSVRHQEHRQVIASSSDPVDDGGGAGIAIPLKPPVDQCRMEVGLGAHEVYPGARSRGEEHVDAVPAETLYQRPDCLASSRLAIPFSVHD